MLSIRSQRVRVLFAPDADRRIQARLLAAGRKRPRAARGAASPHRTQGGEPVIVRRKDGTLQMRRAQPGRLTHEGEQAFLAAVAVTANLRLAAAAVGAAHTSFYWRKRTNPAFARECRLALRRGYDALELALLEGWSAASHEHNDWRHNEPPAMPPMTVNQALQLLYLHQKEARLNSVEPHQLRRRPRESRAAQSERVAAMWEERQRRAREEFEVAEAERWARGEPAWGPAGAALRAELGLPDLAQVTGWSKADPAKAPHDETRALFGGWRLQPGPSTG